MDAEEDANNIEHPTTEILHRSTQLRIEVMQVYINFGSRDVLAKQIGRLGINPFPHVFWHFEIGTMIKCQLYLR